MSAILQKEQGSSITFGVRRPKGKDHEVCDVVVNGVMMGTFYPFKEGIRFLSKHLPDDPGEAVTITRFFPPAIEIAMPLP